MDDQTNASLGLLLRDSRQQHGLTQRELAERAGLSVGAVRDLEQGRCAHPRARSIEAIADVLDLSAAHRVRLRQLALPRRPEPAVATEPAQISVLGPLTVHRPTEAVSLGSGRHRVVLARLALTPRRAVSRDELIRILWAEDAPQSAANVLQTHVSRLRRILEPQAGRGTAGVLTLTPGGYQLRLDDEHLDLLAYRSRLADWHRTSPADPQRAFDILGGALDMWRGHQAAEDVPELHGDPLVTALTDELIDATIQLAQLGRTLRRLPEVLPRLRRLATRHVWHESLHAWLIIALAASGQQAAALDAYDEVRRRLADELGIDPGAELVEARQAVLEGRTDDRGYARITADRPPTPWQAPAPPADFTGRGRQLLGLERMLSSSRRRSDAQPLTVCVISGMPGVGKTSLALRAAQSARPDFPDGQLYIDLRGADDQSLTVAEAVARLLRGLGVSGRGIPGDTSEACALYRTVLAERRVLVVLDNARNAAQIRPLLPGTGRSAVLVTSRNTCADLEGATHLDLPVLTVQESLDLLGRCLGPARVTADLPTAQSLAEACGRLPVAVRVIAGRLAARPEWTTRKLLHHLVDTRSRLEEFSVGEVAVTASFDLSYRDLAPRTAEVFRAAALVPGEVFSAEAVAALLPADPGFTARTLTTLAGENLLQAAGAEKYRFHDLLRLYAARRAEAETSAGDRTAALGRLADWFLGRTAAAIRLVYPEMVRLPTEADDAPMCFADVDAALSWLDDEAGSLVALIDTLAGGPHRARSWQLADQLRGYFFVRRDAVRWLATGRAGLAAAEAAGDLTAQAAMHQTLGQAHWSVGRQDLALDAYRRGTDAARRSGWLVAEAYLLHNLGLVHAELGRLDEAEQLYHHALRIGSGREFHHIRAVTLNDLGAMCSEQGRLADAVQHFRAAMEINRDATRRPSFMANSANLGMTLRQLDEFDAAHQHLREALGYYRETGSVHGQMSVLDELSQLHRQRGEWHAAVDDATEAVRIADEMRDRKARAGVLNTLGFALLGARAVTDAQARFEASLQLSRAGGYAYFEAQAGIGVAEAALSAGAVEQARIAAGDALEIARRKKYEILAGDASLTLAKVCLAAGDNRAAAAHCHAAQASYVTGGAPGKIREADSLAARISPQVSQLAGLSGLTGRR